MKALLFDFSRVLLFPKDKNDPRSLNERHKAFSQENPDYAFFDHFQLNQELLDYIHTLKDSLGLYIFTSGSIQEAPALQPYLKDFKKIYSASKLGYSKTDSAVYTWLANDIGLPPEEILFVDDNEGNVEAAKEAGMRGIKYEENELVIQNFKKY